MRPVKDSIVVTGAAALTRFGRHEASWEALREGRSGARTARGAWTVVDLDDALLEGTPSTIDRCSRLALAAAREACAQAGIAPGGRKPRLAVVLGAARPGEHARVAVTERARLGERIPGSLSTSTMTAGPAFAVGAEFGAGGPVFVTSGTCASGALAVFTAIQLLRGGVADVVVTGGAEACLSDAYLAQTAALRILSPDVCRPFDAARNGTWLGEGAGILVLEREDPRALARIAGSGVSYDGAMLADEEGGAALGQAAATALAEAGGGVDAVFAHAAGTRKGDAIEGSVIARVLGGKPVPVMSAKSTFGHTLGASAGIELAMAVESLRRGVMPPTANLETPDPSLGLTLPRREEKRSMKALLKTSSAMGGLHAAFVLARA